MNQFFVVLCCREPTVKPQATEGGDLGAKLPYRRGRVGASPLSPTTPPFIEKTF